MSWMFCRPRLPTPSPAVVDPNVTSAPPPDPLPAFKADLSIDGDTRLSGDFVIGLIGKDAVRHMYGSSGVKTSSNSSNNTSGNSSNQFSTSTKSAKSLSKEDEVEDAVPINTNSAKGVKGLRDNLLRSASVMKQINNDIYADARQATLQPIPEEQADDHARGLFPNDPNVAHSQPRLMHQNTYAMGCAADEAVDVVAPETRKRKY
ncbi:unnamed protein product [Calypogeia fissa]